MGPVKMVGFTGDESAAFWFGKAFYASWFVVAPLAFGAHSILATIGLQLIAEMFMGWVLAFMF